VASRKSRGPRTEYRGALESVSQSHESVVRHSGFLFLRCLSSGNWVLATNNCFMTWVKICGITNLDDALVAVDAGADAVGFVFYEKSPRFVTVETAREIIAKLPESVEKVGVFVVNSGVEWDEVVHSTGLTAVQQYLPLQPDVRSHQTKATGFPRPLKFFLAWPLGLLVEAGASIQGLANDFERMGEELRAHGSPEGLVDIFFLDSGGAASPGGTGTPFDWTKAVPLAEGMRRGRLKLVVAGGLRPENVDSALDTLHPWGVDVATGVEARPGKKDPEKVRAFVRAVREYDARVS
jgi:phosphoribosylanthranilate isomerase